MKVKEQHAGHLRLPPIAEEMTGQARLDVVHIREDATGHLLCWGSGEFGQHGHGYRKEVIFFDGAVEKFCGAPEGCVKHMACGASHTAIVTHSNDLYVWGNGNSGQLGSNDLGTKPEPQYVQLPLGSAPGSGIVGVACGGRHSMVWTDAGQVFTFGNNFNAQLGYDFREKKYKDTQSTFWENNDDQEENNVTQPTLLKSLQHRPVVQVACGSKHSVFRFRDGGIACCGDNSYGQVGCGTRDDALAPRILGGDLAQGVKMVATGAHHSLAITVSGEVYVWGYSRACGSRDEDILAARKCPTHHNNIVGVAGGGMHSMALSANGSVYTWGGGADGQLGHGEKVRFLSRPRRVRDRHVVNRCIQIAAGENFSAAVTEKGLLYMWGKNSHTIMSDKPTSHKVLLPHGVNKNFRGGRISAVVCGSWHALALIGRPVMLERNTNEISDESSDEVVKIEEEDLDEMDVDAVADSNSDEELVGTYRRETSRLEREKTTVSLADFYAPTPDPKTLRSPSPELFFPKEDDDDVDRINSTRSAATMIVRVPSQPLLTYADAGTSPMTLTTASTNSSSVTTSSRVPSPISELPRNKIEKLQRKLSRPEKKFREFDPMKFERDKLRSSKSPVSEVVQLSRSSADSFILPREPTGLSKKHVDFSEMEEIRLKGPKSPEKLSRQSRHRESREASPTRTRHKDSLSPFKDHMRDLNHSRSRHRFLDSQLSHKSDSAILMESPLFRGSRSTAMTELLSRPSPDTPLALVDDRHYKHHVPKHQARKYKTGTLTETNFGLQISKSQTVVAPLHGEIGEQADRLAQLRRYAATHNPQVSSRPSPDRLRPIKNRQVSIPGGRAESPGDERGQLFVGKSGGGTSKDKSGFSSGSLWKERDDMDRLGQRKIAAAGIVKMYLTRNEVVGTMDNPLYTSLSDGRGHSDPLLDSDSLTVQPLMKRVKHTERHIKPIGIELPTIAINHTPNAANMLSTRTLPEKRTFEREELDLTLGNSTSRGISQESAGESRVS
ncbi:uncharacterized protein LOC128226856 isoform X2 [Mya arenaria]|uniref:uncharacterized protein LOC128226856 isoform X2 n=1 Tax=Mya arenaria TaxID=6604 RepID=UPI0022E428EF|nr:uncharacterized protein LOC128226856 isoform X2 [Mya arenaria]